jgi:serine/threonine-protein kinase
MSPEQVRGWPVDHRADLYALGVLLFQVLTGRLPFESTDVYELEKLHVEAPPPRPSAYAPVAPHVEAAILKALEKEPARRHASATAFLAAVSGF